MSIQRYWNRSGMLYPHPDDTDNFMAWHGPVVTYADHVAAIAEAYELGRTDGILLGEEKAHRDSVIVHEGAAENRGYRKGYAAGLDAAREAVAAWNCGWPDDLTQHTGCPCQEQALAAIDALKESHE